MLLLLLILLLLLRCFFSVLLPFFNFFFSFSSSLSFASKFPHVNSTQGKLAVPDFGQVTVDYGKWDQIPNSINPHSKSATGCVDFFKMHQWCTVLKSMANYWTYNLTSKSHKTCNIFIYEYFHKQKLKFCTSHCCILTSAAIWVADRELMEKSMHNEVDPVTFVITFNHLYNVKSLCELCAV